MEGKITGGWPAAQNETLLPDQPVEQTEQPDIAVLDGFCGDLVRSNDIEPVNLAFGKLRRHRAGLFVRQIGICPVDQQRCDMICIRLECPAEMEHRFGQPFIGIILDQQIEKAQHFIFGNYRTAVIFLFQPPDDRRAIHYRFQIAVAIAKIKGRQQCHLRFWIALRSAHRATPADIMSYVPIAQQRQHLSRIGRSRRAHQFEPVGHIRPFHPPSV